MTWNGTCSAADNDPPRQCGAFTVTEDASAKAIPAMGIELSKTLTRGSLTPVLSADCETYISLPRMGSCAPKRQKKTGSTWDAGQDQKLSAIRQGAVHERTAARIFSHEVACVERGHPQGSQRDTAAPPGRKSESPGSCRPGFLRDGSRNRAASARSAA